MPIAQRSSNRHSTDAARVAAQEARKRKAFLAQDPNRPEVFVVRGIEDERRFEWEIRRFGGVLLGCSRARYDTIQDAQIAGRQVLQVFSA
jgi:hypothetical protein